MDSAQLQIICPDPAIHAQGREKRLGVEWSGIEAVLRAGRISGSHCELLLPALFPAQNPQMSNGDV
jgi:hypothetical protein